MRATTWVFGLLTMVALLTSASGCKRISRVFNSGGTLYVVEVSTGEPNISAIVDRAVIITENRLNAIGIDGEAARTGENRFEVKVFGDHEREVFRAFLFKTYKIELKKVISPPSPSPAQTFSDRAKAQEAATADQQVLPYHQRSDSDPLSHVIVERASIVTGEHIRSATAFSVTGSDFDYQISFNLNADGAQRLGEWTGQNINNYIAVVVNDHVQSVAYISGQIWDSGEIRGRFSKAEAEALAAGLNSGYLPAELRVVEERPFE